MDEDTKGLINLNLALLKKILIENHVSIGFDKATNAIMFFDTDTYLDAKKFNGVSVKLESLVK